MGVLHSSGVAGTIALKSCAPKLGQRLTRDDIRTDGTFIFHDKEVGKCLGSESITRKLAMVQCNDEQRWRWLKDREQVQHVVLGWCLDAADEESPILYPCLSRKLFESKCSTSLMVLDMLC